MKISPLRGSLFARIHHLVTIDEFKMKIDKIQAWMREKRFQENGILLTVGLEKFARDPKSEWSQIKSVDWIAADFLQTRQFRPRHVFDSPAIMSDFASRKPFHQASHSRCSLLMIGRIPVRKRQT